MTFPGRLGAVARDPGLRLASLGLLLFGAWAASIGVHQSLLAARFGLGDGALTLLLVAALAVAVAASLGVGVLTDARPWRRRMAALASTLLLAGSVLVWAAPGPWAFVAAHALLMPAGGTIFAQLLAVARLGLRAHPAPERDALLAVVRAAFAVPFVVVLPLWGLAFGWGAPLLALYPATAVMAGALLLMAWRLWPPDAAAPWGAAPSGLSTRAALREVAAPGLLARVALVGAFQAGAALNGVVLGLVFAGAGRPLGDVGLFFGLFVAVEVAATLALGPILRARGRLGTVALGVGLYAAFLALLPPLAPHALVWALAILAGLGGALIYAPSLAYLQDLLAARPGAGSALSALQRVSQDGLAAALFGLGALLGGQGAAAVLGACATVAAVLLILRLERR